MSSPACSAQHDKRWEPSQPWPRLTHAKSAKGQCARLCGLGDLEKGLASCRPDALCLGSSCLAQHPFQRAVALPAEIQPSFAAGEVCARPKAGVCSGERVDLHKGLGGPKAGDSRPGRGESGGRAVPEQPHGAALRCPVPGPELPRLHDRPPALSPGPAPPCLMPGQTV